MEYKRAIVIVLLLLFCLTLQTVPALAAESLAVAVSQSQLLNVAGVERVAVANPEIADVLVVSGSEVLVVGKTPGVTTLYVWTWGGRSSYRVEVDANDWAIASQIKTILGYDNITVSKIGKTVILEGTVADQYQKARAEKIAAAYSERVVNMLELTKPVQVKIEAKVIEINREKTKNLGLKWGNNNVAGSPGGFVLGQSFANPLTGQSFGNLGGYAAVNAQLDALVKNGMAKILSQPNVITLSGDKANIMVGGQIPVPVALENNKITVEWKDYGIKLAIAPEVSAQGLINSKVKAEVSSLDWNSTRSIKLGADMEIPPLKVNQAETAITLSSGQTMAIGGLISSQTTKDVTKLPLLGDLPVIGHLFKSTSFSRNETELLILITPTIIDSAEYLPQATPEMQSFSKENPWGGTVVEGKNKGTDR